MSSLLADDGPLDLSLSFANSITKNYRNDSFWKQTDTEAEFPAHFPGLLNLYLTAPQHEQLAVTAILCCFHRLDISFVRRECLRLVSLACWKSLSGERREFEFQRQSRLKETWAKAKEVAEGAFFGRLIDDCIDSGSQIMADLFSFCLLQWPTKRYLSVLLDDKLFTIKCRQKGYKFVEKIEELLYGTAIYDPTSEKAEWDSDDHLEDFYERIEQFQLIVYGCDDSNPLATASLFELSDDKKSVNLLRRHISTTIRAAVCQSFGWQDDEWLVARLAHTFSLHRDRAYNGSLWELPGLEDTKRMDVMRDLLLPLTPQFLNQTDYMSRLYWLLRFDFTKSLDETLRQSLHRCKPVMDKKLGLVFDGWYRYASHCHHMEGSMYQFTISPMTTDGAAAEWRRLKIGDSLYLCKLVKDDRETFKYEYAQVAKITGIVKESRTTTNTTVITDTPQTRQHSTKLLFTLDRQVEDVNFVIRLDPKDNSLLFMDALQSSLQRKTVLSPSIGMDSYLYGQKSGSVDSVSAWIDSPHKALVVEGPPNSGKTTALIRVLKARPQAKTIIMVPTVEQADLLAQHLAGEGVVDQQRFVRLGYSPTNLSIGRVSLYLEWRNQILSQTDDYFDTIDFSTAITSSCEGAIASLEQLSDIDERGKILLAQLKQLVPLEYIQNDDHREAYLFKYHANVALMTFGYAAAHSELLSEVDVEFVLMDDCNLVSELMAMIPLLRVKGSPRLVLFGDALVEPVSDDDLLLNYNFGASLFRRMSLLDCLPTVKLSNVHNVPKDLSHLFTNFTIGNCTVDFVEVECDDAEHVVQTKQNVLEAEELVEYYMLECAGESDCVCLAPYNAQCDLLSDVFADKQVDGVPRIYTIDKFSGSHAQVVLCSLTAPRMNSFLRERLPMLSTRGLKRLIIFLSPHINILQQ